MDVLERITQMKNQRGWSNYKLAKEAGLPEGSLNNLFRLNHQPSMATLDAICKGFGISLSQFFAQNGEAITLNKEQKDLLDIWSALNTNQRTSLLDLLKSMQN
ncbi:MAG: helix-turn-helix domain-containing protein [Defluviitaleaceae bacterium]|nr:helix-turn-helix domain-containing protein [Defluviitaleaceae bacterium]